MHQQQLSERIAAAVADIPGAVRATPPFNLRNVDPNGFPGFAGDKRAGEHIMAAYARELGDWQERLFASSKAGAQDRVLLVVQGMDTSGKGGIMRHVIGQVDPQGVSHYAFKKPTKEELAHHFLWRIRKQVPQPGMIGVFDRSHYEDVLIVRVHDLVPPSQWQARYEQINDFETELVAQGVHIVKVMLHISVQEQHDRLAERLARPDKHWKYNPGDLVERAHWPAYQEAYEAAINLCSAAAPWHVIPAGRKWFARLAVQQLLLETLRKVDPQWPPADFNVREQIRLLG